MTLQTTLLIIAYTLSGITLKISDFSGEKGNTFKSCLSAFICAFFFGVLIAESAFSSALLLGIIIGVILAKKVDKPNMILGLIITQLIALYFGFEIPTLWLLLIVALFTFIDEISHDLFYTYRELGNPIFRFRPFLKLVMILLASLSLIQIIQLMYFLCFDFSYDLTNILVTARRRTL